MGGIDNPLWYRVAPLRPRLRTQVRVRRRVSRGEVGYLLWDEASHRFLRVDAMAYAFIGRLDGSASVGEIWHAVHERLGEDAPDQHDVLRMLGQLNDAELLVQASFADPLRITERRRKVQRRLRAAAANPLAFRVALFDPGRLLARLQPLARALTHPAAALLWTVLVTAGAAIAWQHRAPLGSDLARFGPTGAFLLQMWLAYPLVKLLHEASHALAVKGWSGEVREVGLRLVMLSPLPYVDASAATAFHSRARRVLVSAAGVMAELAVAAVAVMVWAWSDAPALRHLALAVATSCGVSTLLLNANPLARFDGYHMLCDLADLPNLAARGKAMLAHLFARALGDESDQAAPERTARDAIVVSAYGLAAWLYQAAVIGGIAWWLYGPYPSVALALLALGAVATLLPPLLHALRHLRDSPSLAGRRPRAALRLAAVAAFGAVVLFAVPVPSSTLQTGVVWAPAESILRVETDGEVVSLDASPQQAVQAQQVVARLERPELLGELATVRAQLTQIDTDYYKALLTQPLEAKRLSLEQAAAQSKLARIEQQLQALTVRAGLGGTLLIGRHQVQPGQFFTQGTELGFVLPPGPGMVVKVALTEAQAALVRHATQRISVRLPGHPARVVEGRLQRETPEVTQTLPTPVLGSAFGGPMLSDPGDPDQRRTVSPVSLVEVVVPQAQTEFIGLRAEVRFDHGAEPLGWQWARSLRQAFLGRLGPGSLS